MCICVRMHTHMHLCVCLCINKFMVAGKEFVAIFCVSQVVRAFNNPSGYCHPPPPGCPMAVYAIMVQCW